jgi:hypothetical protein
MFEDLIRQSADYYTHQITTHGATPAGVDWNSAESQELRFRQLLRICRAYHSFSLNDYGCGYGALAHFLQGHSFHGRYCGFDASETMIREALRLGEEIEGAKFISDRSLLAPCDYTVASGIFNVRQDTSPERWTEYILATLGEMDSLSDHGFSFNMLTSYSDPPKMRGDLFYGDPCFFFDYAKRHFSREVYLLHDYGLYEFTIGVRKQSSPAKAVKP